MSAPALEPLGAAAAAPAGPRPRRSIGLWLLHFFCGLQEWPRFSLGALVLGVLAAGLGYGLSYGSFGLAAGGWAFYLFLVVALFAYLCTTELRRRAARISGRMGGYFLVAVLLEAGLLAGWGHGLTECFVGHDSLRAQYSRVKTGLEQYMADSGEYPAALRDLGSNYLPPRDVERLDSRIVYTPPAVPGGVADLYVCSKGPIHTWSIREGLLLPPKAVAGAKAAAPGAGTGAVPAPGAGVGESASPEAEK